MGLLAKLKEWKKRIQDPYYDYEEWETNDAWDEIVYDRDDLKINDRQSREEYIRGCLEQIAEASREVDELQGEYDAVTSYLKDMEEIEALPPEETEIIYGYAAKLNTLKAQEGEYLKRTNRMSDAKYRQMERMESELAEAYKKLKDTEDYRTLIKKDLKKIENEKQAYYIRRDDLKRTIDDCRSMSIVCLVAVIVCFIILAVLQFGFKMNVRIGYLAAALAGAVGTTLIFVKNNDSRSELAAVERGISRIIQLQNTVKIRYVNNANLLEYLYVKYQVSSSSELGKDISEFSQEREERRKYEEAASALSECEKDFLHELRRYQIKDPLIWLHQTEAILDRREMVEIRHKLIIQRQSLRRRMDYNREIVAANAQNEIKDLVAKYPKYAGEMLEIVAEYEKQYR